MKKVLYFLTGCAMFLAACDVDKETVENTEYEKLTYGDPKYSYIKILNLSPGSPVVNFYMDGKKFSTKQSTSGVENAGYTYNQVFPDINYAVTSPGNHALTAKIIPSATTDASLEVFNQAIAPAAGKYYTLIPNGTYDAVNKKIPSFLVVEDSKPALDSTKIFVRLVNVVSGGPSINMLLGTSVADPNTTEIISNVAVNTASNWAEIYRPGGGSTPALAFVLTDATTDLQVSGTLTTTSMIKGRAYTVYLRGIWGVTGTTGPSIGTYTTFY